MFKRFFNLIRGFFGVFVSDMEKKHPRAMLEVVEEDFRKALAELHDKLAEQTGYANRLAREIRQGESRSETLRRHIKTFLGNNDRKKAAEWALQRRNLLATLDKQREKLVVARKNLESMLAAREKLVRDYRARIERLREKISEVEMVEARARIEEMASGVETGREDPAETLRRLEKQLEERYDKAVGRVEVAEMLGDAAAADPAAEAEAALAEFEAEEREHPVADAGRVVEHPDASAAPGKSGENDASEAGRIEKDLGPPEVT